MYNGTDYNRFSRSTEVYPLNTDTILLILRALLLCASFTGLCAEFRTLLKLDRFVAPFAAGCAIIAVLMLTGMAGMLQTGFFALYIAGFFGLVHAYVIRKKRPDFPLIGLMLVFAAALVWRFYNCPLHHVDDISHWGLVARTILKNNAFPDVSTPTIKFQAYPVGSATFIYYICRTLESSEGMYVIAQSFLMALGFLPMLSHIKENRRYLYPVFLAAFIFLFLRNHFLVNLQVDWLLPFMGLGSVASVLHYRRNLRKAVLIAILSTVSIVYIKNSGMFFAFWTVLALQLVARRNGCSRKKALLLFLAVTVAFVGAYMLWSLRVKLAYPAGFESKHAVSASAYAEELSRKGSALAVQIGLSMLKFLILPGIHQLSAWLVLIVITIALTLGCRLLPGQKIHQISILKGAAFCACTYLIWYTMLYFMYLFSMPEAEAIELASINRYTSTGLLFMMGLSLLMLFAFYGREGLVLTPLIRKLYLAGAACIAIALIAIFPFSTMKEKLFVRETELIPIRQRLVAAQEQLQLPDGSRIMAFFVNAAEKRSPALSFYHVKYEFDTADVISIVSGTLEDNPETVYAQYTHGRSMDWLDDPIERMDQYIDDCDAFILFDCEPEFDARVREYLETYEGDTPVIFAYPEV